MQPDHAVKCGHRVQRCSPWFGMGRGGEGVSLSGFFKIGSLLLSSKELILVKEYFNLLVIK